VEGKARQQLATLALPSPWRALTATLSDASHPDRKHSRPIEFCCYVPLLHLVCRPTHLQLGSALRYCYRATPVRPVLNESKSKSPPCVNFLSLSAELGRSPAMRGPCQLRSLWKTRRVAAPHTLLPVPVEVLHLFSMLTCVSSAKRSLSLCVSVALWVDLQGGEGSSPSSSLRAPEDFLSEVSGNFLSVLLAMLIADVIEVLKALATLREICEIGWWPDRDAGRSQVLESWEQMSDTAPSPAVHRVQKRHRSAQATPRNPPSSNLPGGNTRPWHPKGATRGFTWASPPAERL